MKLAVISDVHGNLAALEAVLDDIERAQVDAILNLGDIVSGPLDPVAVAERLMPMQLMTVRGNHDRHIARGRAADWHIDARAREALSSEQRAWLGELPLTASFAGKVLLTHGVPDNDSLGWMDDMDARRPRDFIESRADGLGHEVLLCGHTHVPRSLRLGDGRLLVNPGSVGLPFDIGSPDARYGVLERHRDGWHVALKTIAYDHEATARRADELGFPLWAEAYRAGWVLPKGL